MRDRVVMRDLCCTKKARHEPRQRAFLREQNANALTILFAEELRGERDNGARLLGRIGSDEKMHFVQLVSLAPLSLRLGVWLGNRFRCADDFFPGANPGFIDVARFIAWII